MCWFRHEPTQKSWMWMRTVNSQFNHVWWKLIWKIAVEIVIAEITVLRKTRKIQLSCITTMVNAGNLWGNSQFGYWFQSTFRKVLPAANQSATVTCILWNVQRSIEKYELLYTMGIVHKTKKNVKYYCRVKLKPQDGNKGTSPNPEFQQNLKKWTGSTSL